MTTTLYGIRNCDAVRKARAFLEARGAPFAFHDFKAAGIERTRLEAWCEAEGWERVLNRAGTTFRALDAVAKADLTQEKAIALMLAQPSMIKRPVLEHAGTIHVGWKPGACRDLFDRA